MTLEEKIDALTTEISELKKVVGQKYTWEEKASESGIQIVGGPTTIQHRGLLKGVCAVPTPQGLVFAFILQDEVTNKFAILSPDLIKPA
jgi:hypothetical protein